MNELNIREADRLEITILVDNYTDMLLVESTGVYRRAQIPLPQILLAEHGFSCLIKVYAGAEEHTVLMDAAATPACLLNNIELLEAKPESIESIVLSHGHPAHFLGLAGLLKLISENKNSVDTPKVPLILHPDAFLERRLNIPAIGHQVPIPVLNEDVMKEAGAVLVSPKKLFRLLMALSVQQERLSAKFDPIIQPTIEEMKRIDPDYVVPMHCTGWKAINRFAEEIPEKSLLNTVGTTYVFGGDI